MSQKDLIVLLTKCYIALCSKDPMHKTKTTMYRQRSRIKVKKTCLEFPNNSLSVQLNQGGVGDMYSNKLQ